MKRKAKDRANSIVDSLGYDFSKFTVADFIEHLEKISRKKFHFIPCDLVARGAFGCWVTSDNDELIFYEETTSPSHRIHIIMHEIAHKLSGHQTEYKSPEQVRRILQDKKFDLANALQRHHEEDDKKSEMERDVEMIAFLLKQKVLKARQLEGLTQWDTIDDATRNYLSSSGLMD